MVQFQRQTSTYGGSVAQVNAGLRTHMLNVYNHMMVGLLLTAAMGYAFSLLIIGEGGKTTELGVFLFQSPFKWVLMLAPLGVVMFLSFRIHSMSSAGARLTFYAYSALNGISFSFIALAFSGATIATAFLSTAATFGAMSLWGYTTKRDLTGMGSFLMMALWGVIIASIINIFMASSMMHFVISIASVLIFTGLTAYDTQKIRDFYFEVEGDETMMGRAAILGALNLYLDFINIFLSMLQLMRGSDN